MGTCWVQTLKKFIIELPNMVTWVIWLQNELDKISSLA
jgi:hypothetical protein